MRVSIQDVYSIYVRQVYKQQVHHQHALCVQDVDKQQQMTANSTAMPKLQSSSQLSLLTLLLIRLNLITNLESLPSIKAHTALSALTHLLDIFLDVLK